MHTTVVASNVAARVIAYHLRQPVAYELQFNGHYKRFACVGQAVAVYNWICEGLD